MCRALAAGSRWKDWKIIPTWRARNAANAAWAAGAFVPSTTTVPRVGVRRSASTDTSVDLPDPERPTIAVEPAGPKVQLTRSSAMTGPVGLAYSTLTSTSPSRATA